MLRMLLVLAMFATVAVSAGKRGYGLPCIYMGKPKNRGEVWSPHACAVCKCVGMHTRCVMLTCPACDGEEGEISEDQCCAPCNGQDIEPTETGFCSWRGVTYEDSEKYTLNACTDCKCSGGASRCTVRSCPPRECADGEYPTEVVPGECCHQCIEDV